MRKKILSSLMVIAIIGIAAGITGTQALFSDTETSTGNILKAGTLDLKVDHTFSSYNGAECEKVLVSDTSNIVEETGVNAVETYDENPAWTAEIEGAKWIWKSEYVENPTQDETYTFVKTFDWAGGISSAELEIAADNTYVVELNGNEIGKDEAENNFGSTDTYDVSSVIEQGSNTIKFEVTNIGGDSDPERNPAGLLYRLEIERDSCELWEEKDLEDEKFFEIDDVKPGDHGKEVISLHAYDNDAWACLLVNGTDIENDLLEPEEEAGDISENQGELSSDLDLVAWIDENKNNQFETSESQVYMGSFSEYFQVPVHDSGTGNGVLEASSTDHLGIVWCFGELSLDTTTDPVTISCDGSTATSISQSDWFEADLTAYVEQVRNNQDFKCDSIGNTDY